MIIYNPEKDLSEEFGWKKFNEEQVPSEDEQDFWAKIILIFTIVLGILTFIGV